MQYSHIAQCVIVIDMEIRVAKNALKHGLSEEQIRFAFEHPVEGFEGRTRLRDLKRVPPSYAQIGIEPHDAKNVELVYSYTRSGVLVFHANWLTKKFIQEMKEAR